MPGSVILSSPAGCNRFLPEPHGFGGLFCCLLNLHTLLPGRTNVRGLPPAVRHAFFVADAVASVHTETPAVGFWHRGKFYAAFGGGEENYA